jgi:hypothetical protein
MRRLVLGTITHNHDHGEAGVGQPSCTPDTARCRHCCRRGLDSGWEAAMPCQARYVTDAQAWEPHPPALGATDGGLPMAQLCPVAHTKQIRPPASYTDALKRVQMRAYGDTGSPANFEEDHLIPLALGGAPGDPQNLWVEPHFSSNEKDTVEGAAHDAVCLGKIALPDAHHRMATDWYQLGKDLNVIS